MTAPHDPSKAAAISKAVAGAWAKEVFRQWYDSNGAVPPMIGLAQTSFALLNHWVNDRAPTVDMQNNIKVPCACFAELPWGRLFKLDPFTRPTRFLPPKACVPQFNNIGCMYDSGRLGHFEEQLESRKLPRSGMFSQMDLLSSNNSGNMQLLVVLQ